MEFDLKWVHMARYELILRLDGALWLTIIFKPLLTPKRAFTIQFESYFWMFVTENVSMIWNVTIGIISGPYMVLMAQKLPPRCVAAFCEISIFAATPICTPK